MTSLLDDLATADTSSVLGHLDGAAADRVAVEIPLASITRSIQVCGVDAKDEDVLALARNIEEFGLQHPVEVNVNGDGTFTLVQGNSRRLAHVQLGRTVIPAFVDTRPATDEVVAEFICTQASENAHRKQLTVLETLNTIDRLTSPPCSCGRNAVGRIMRLPETTLKRYWRVHRTLRERGVPWLPEVAQWLNTSEATWAAAGMFAANRELERQYASTGQLPGVEPDAVTEVEGGQSAPPERVTRRPVRSADSLLRQAQRLVRVLHDEVNELPQGTKEELRAVLLTAADLLGDGASGRSTCSSPS
ncbi:ParB-like chromosome segregation protein Spo0J [Crossiella equi]|uniref:ParB-like chromosome segregation protein Spo0J n=1 Tax=Crossiella equi TaxID=130796 RepID=A0ABS5A3L0_9PSEU|nr:ParB N-terminal domain-containing protein [Crossiella equi]MBP2471166.1 ParB-like chromosome segregation protein Spo0J [Crossiella equi]